MGQCVCLHLNKTHSWHDNECHERYEWLCDRDLQQIPSTIIENDNIRLEPLMYI